MPQSSPEAYAAPSPALTPWPVPLRVLAAVDTGVPSRWAVRAAESFAGRFGAHLGLVHVLDTDTMPADADELLRAGEAFVVGYSVSASPPEGRVDRMFRIGSPPDQIVSAAAGWHADLIVVGTHGRTGVDRLLLGSTAEGVLRRATCPVACVGQEPPDPVALRRILIAVDDSEQAELAARARGRCSRRGRARGRRWFMSCPFRPRASTAWPSSQRTKRCVKRGRRS